MPITKRIPLKNSMHFKWLTTAMVVSLFPLVMPCGPFFFFLLSIIPLFLSTLQHYYIHQCFLARSSICSFPLFISFPSLWFLCKFFSRFPLSFIPSWRSPVRRVCCDARTWLGESTKQRQSTVRVHVGKCKRWIFIIEKLILLN